MAQKSVRKEAARGLINIRVSRAERHVIDRAAKLAGKTRSEFMLDAARRAAQESLLETTPFVVDSPAFERFKAMLEAPAQSNERLKALLRKQAPWDHDRR
jgi:uncharacterized protein (DUF1778 family)